MDWWWDRLLQVYLYSNLCEVQLNLLTIGSQMLMMVCRDWNKRTSGRKLESFTCLSLSLHQSIWQRLVSLFSSSLLSDQLMMWGEDASFLLHQFVEGWEDGEKAKGGDKRRIDLEYPVVVCMSVCVEEVSTKKPVVRPVRVKRHTAHTHKEVKKVVERFSSIDFMIRHRLESLQVGENDVCVGRKDFLTVNSRCGK